MILKKISIHSFCDNQKREKITQYEYNVGSFAFELYDSKKNPVNLSDCKSAAYYGTKADGTLIGNECEISDNRVIITPTIQMTACAGLLRGIIECQFENGNLRFFGINFDIMPAPEKAEIESTDEFTVLDKTLAEVRELLAKAENGEFNGADGQDGKDGADGIGITKSEINSNGELVLTYSDETSVNLGTVVRTDENTNNSINELKCSLTELGLQVFESYPYSWMYAIKDIRVTDGSTIAIGYVKRTSTRNAIVLYLVENGALSTAKLYANVDSDITGYATYSNSAKTITMAVNWDEIPYDTVVQFDNNYVLCSAWCYGNTRLDYLLNKAKEDAVSYAENKTSNFESTGKADKIVSNVQIVGMNHTDARFLISNFNRHYNGDDTDLLYIYTTDDTGATANLIKGIRVTEEIGTITVDLSNIVSGAVIRFDYDFSGIADGTRLQGTGTGFLVKKNCYILESVSKSDFENYEEKIPIDFGFFEKFAVIGDSYASGEIYVADPSQSKGYTVADYYKKSWGQILARKYGATCINLSVGGLTTRTWLTNSHGLTKMLAEEPQELYLCALGINDEISLGTSYLGTIKDITNYDSYSDYPDTFYGNYGKIIEQIKEHAPKSKIVLMSMAYLYNATEDSFTVAIKNISDYYNIPFINIKDDAFYAKDSIYKTGQSYNHPTAPLYAGMAQANERLFCRCAVNYYDYFKDFT